eukprot:2543941-Prymnesium_polylepis.1
MYLVLEAPQSRVALEYRLMAEWRTIGHRSRESISPRIDTYLVPVTAPQGAHSARYRHTAHHRP